MDSAPEEESPVPPEITDHVDLEASIVETGPSEIPQEVHAEPKPEPKPEEDEDWDIEMDLGETGGAKVALEPPTEKFGEPEVLQEVQAEPEPEPEEDWDAEMNLGKTSDAQADLEPPMESVSEPEIAQEAQVEPETLEDAPPAPETEEQVNAEPPVDETPEPEAAQIILVAPEPEVDEDWDIEMDLGKTGGAKALPSPPPSASSTGSWHGSMAAATAGYTGLVTRLGGPTKSDVEESWDDFDIDIMSSEETPKVMYPSTLVPHTKVAADLSDWDDDEDAAVQTIKVPAGQSVLPKPILFTPAKKSQTPMMEENFEEDFSFPDDLAHLSLRPLKQRPSKSNLLDGWGDTNLSSSTTYSSEAPSLGFDASESPSSTSNSMYSHTGPETDDDEEALLDGLVLPEGLFDSEKNSRQLHKIIEERKRTAATDLPTSIASPQEDDFESGLVIDDDVDFDLSKVKHHRPTLSNGRSAKALSMQPPSRPTSAGPPARAQSFVESPEMARASLQRSKSPASLQRSKSPLGRTFASVARAPSPIQSPTPLTARAQRSSFHSPIQPMVSPLPPSSFQGTPTKDPLKRQSSTGKLQPSGGSSDMQRKGIARKSSLSSIDVSTTTSGSSVRVTLKRPSSGLGTVSPQHTRRPPLFPPSSSAHTGRYNTPASARSKSMHTPLSPATMLSLSTSAAHLRQSPNLVPPTPPGTPSSNPIALRLTMSTSSSRNKTRPALSNVFPHASMSTHHTIPRPTSFASAVKSPASSIRSLLHTPTPTTPNASSYGWSPSSSRAVSISSVSSPSRAASGRPALSRSSTVSAVAAAVPRPPQAKIMKRPKRLRAYGDGTELDGIEDLPTDRDQEGKYRVTPKGYSSGGRVVRKDSGAGRVSGEWTPSSMEGNLNDSTGSTSSRLAQRRRADLSSTRASVSSTATATPTLGKAALSPSTPSSSPKTPLNDKRRSLGGMPLKRRPMLIRNLNKVGTAKVVGEMRWNPQTLRWEGNDHVLRDFDNAMGSSTRPALITQLTGAALGSPVNSTSGIPGARVVGNMLFDPVKMCWVSQLPPEEEEPDVFAEMADDEDDDGGDWDKSKGGTIRGLANVRIAPPSPRPSAPPGKVLIDRVSPARGGSGVLVVVGNHGDGNPSPSHSTHSRSQSELESGSERGYNSVEQERLSKEGDDVEGGIVSQLLLEQTSMAEKRHQEEMKGWFITPTDLSGEDTPSNGSLAAPNQFAFPAYGHDFAHSEMDRTFLHELRTVIDRSSRQHPL